MRGDLRRIEETRRDWRRNGHNYELSIMAASEDGGVPIPIGDRSIGAGRRQDLTHLRLAGVGADGIDVGQSLFIGALIENCTFRHVDFSRCDFSGTKIVRSVFEDCRFHLADVRSSRFDGVGFTRCDFGSSQIGRTDCRQTTFEACGFEECTLLEGTMEASAFERCSFRGSSVTGVGFSGCSFVDTGLADCSALYLLFDACRFERFSINAESVGFTFGLTRADLASATLVHLGGAEAPPPGEDLPAALASTYHTRRWFVGAAVIDVNFALRPPLLAFRALAEDLLAAGRAGLPCDPDEIDFLVRVLERLREKGALPLLAARDVDRAARRLLRTADGRLDGRDAVLVGRLERLVLSLLDEACAILDREPSDEALVVEMRLVERPVRPLDALCRDVVAASHGDEGATLEFVSGREGSWVETWQALPSVLATIQLALLAVNGLLKELEKAIASGRRLKRTIRGVKTVGAKGVARKRGGREVALLGALDEGAARGLAALRRRASLLTDERLERVDRTLAVVDAMPVGDIEALADYATDRVLAVRVEPVKAARRPRRGRAPAA